jgi:hypothetical protein
MQFCEAEIDFGSSPPTPAETVTIVLQPQPKKALLIPASLELQQRRQTVATERAARKVPLQPAPEWEPRHKPLNKPQVSKVQRLREQLAKSAAQTAELRLKLSHAEREETKRRKESAKEQLRALEKVASKVPRLPPKPPSGQSASSSSSSGSQPSLSTLQATALDNATLASLGSTPKTRGRGRPRKSDAEKAVADKERRARAKMLRTANAALQRESNWRSREGLGAVSALPPPQTKGSLPIEWQEAAPATGLTSVAYKGNGPLSNNAGCQLEMTAD